MGEKDSCDKSILTNFCFDWNIVLVLWDIKPVKMNPS